MKIGPFEVTWWTAARARRQLMAAREARMHRLEEALARARAQLEAADLSPEGPDPLADPEPLFSIPLLAGEEGRLVEPPPPTPSPLAMFHVLDGWVSRFLVAGQAVGGPAELCGDPRLAWMLAVAGGAAGRRVLELGPLEGAHTLDLHRAGAASILAIEGRRAPWLRALVIKELFELARARFWYGDFCRYLEGYAGPRYHLVLASGVLYHQAEPAALLHRLGACCERLLLWTQVADARHPEGAEVEVEGGGGRYRGRRHHYGEQRDRVRNACSGPGDTAVWLYPESLRRCLVDAGFAFSVEHPAAPGAHGPAMLLVASRADDLVAAPFPSADPEAVTGGPASE